MINHLWQEFYNKDLRQIRRKRKYSSNSEVVTSEIKRQTPSPVDSSNHYEPIRHRTAAVPSTSNQSTSTEKINRSYGSLLVGKRSSLTPLVEGDV